MYLIVAFFLLFLVILLCTSKFQAVDQFLSRFSKFDWLFAFFLFGLVKTIYLSLNFKAVNQFLSWHLLVFFKISSSRLTSVLVLFKITLAALFFWLHKQKDCLIIIEFCITPPIVFNICILTSSSKFVKVKYFM